MPRPGPRPYECVRRAWHSDRHPPIRGSLIREIFRIAHEVHGSETKKNKEFLEKLPIVVLKAEAIMYSKANSEAEYSDLKTLWERVNDAIDTIIRRDESTESGDSLQPCIEAALHLGCIPRRSSRSQRNESPRCYLKAQNPEASSVPPNISISKTGINHPNNSPILLQPPQHLTHTTMTSFGSCLKPDYHNNQNRNQIEKTSPCLTQNLATVSNHLASVQAYASSNTWSVYPLCYNSQIQPADMEFYPTKSSNSYSHPMESNKVSAPQNISTFRFDAPDFKHPSNHVRPPDEEQLIACDLTLRLGCVPVSSASTESSLLNKVEHGNPITFL